MKFLKLEAEKKVKKKSQDNGNGKVEIEDLKEGELLDVNKQMNKFKKDLENIINQSLNLKIQIQIRLF